MAETTNPPRWIGPVLCCAAPDPEAYEGVCGLPIESEPCPKHGTEPEPARKTFRVLVTGSRDWPDALAVHRALTELLREHEALAVVHGACRTGADSLAAQWVAQAIRQSPGCVVEEPHPADWGRHGRKAGPIRNQRMIDLGADLVLVFTYGDSRGTADCIRRAEKAGIPVRRYERSRRA